MAESGEVLVNGPGDAWWHDEQGDPVARPTRADQLRSLIETLDQAIAAQPLADEVVAACGDTEPVPTDLARDGARLQVTFYRLRQHLDDLDLDAELEDIRESARSLLLYHQWTLRDGLTTAFRLYVGRRRDRPYRINGLGAPADRLRELRSQLRALAANRDSI
jgi:hypothetical protein